MRLAGYSLLSFVSACVFFGMFHTIAAANTQPPQSPPPNAASPARPSPTALPTPTPEPTLTPLPTLTPTLTPTPAPIASPADLETFFSKYSGEYNVDKELLKKIAKCESGFNSQADTGTYAGMFQFAQQTWINARNEMSLDPNPDLRKNAEESIRTAAYMISRGQQNAWANCL
jgi:hypothetical protein